MVIALQYENRQHFNFQSCRGPYRRCRVRIIVAEQTHFEEAADDGENYDCEDGDDDACERSVSARDRLRGLGVGRYQLQAFRADTTGFMMAAERMQSRKVGGFGL